MGGVGAGEESVAANASAVEIRIAQTQPTELLSRMVPVIVSLTDLDMAADAREFLSISGEDQHLKRIDERNARRGDSHAIEVFGCVGFTPGLVKKLSRNFAEVAVRTTYPADHEPQV